MRSFIGFPKNSNKRKKGNDFSNHTQGIPQGCPLYPVHQNIFLHQLDLRITAFMNQEKSVRYVRYADDMIFAIKSGVDSERIYHRFRKCFRKALKDLNLDETSLERVRGRPSKPLLVLGLLVSIKLNGNLELRVPFLRWKKK